MVEPQKNRLPSGLGQLLPGGVERESQGPRQAVHHPAVPGVGIVLERVGHEAAAADGALGVGDQKLRVSLLVDPQAATGPARALRVVEHEVIGLDIAVDQMMGRADQAAIESLGLHRARALDHLDTQQPVTHQQGTGDGGLDGFLVLPAHHHSVHHRVQLLDRRLLQLDFFGDIDGPAVDDHPAAPLLPNLRQDERQLLAIDLEDRRPELDHGARRQRQDRLQDLTRGSAGRGLPAARAAGLTDGREQQVEIARDVRHRSDGGAGVAGGGLLLDGDDRGEAEDEIDVRLGDLGHEGLGEARQRLQVSSLALRVDRVERQAGLARAGQPGDHDQLVARNLQRDVLEIVDPGTLDRDGGARRGPRPRNLLPPS